MHLKVTNQRNDFLHKLSRELAQEYSVIAVEDLLVSSMIHDHFLAKSFNDAGLSNLISMLDYKVLETGTKLVKVDPSYTSQTCSQCGYVREGDEKLGLSERTYQCPSCGLTIDRDLTPLVTYFLGLD